MATIEARVTAPVAAAAAPQPAATRVRSSYGKWSQVDSGIDRDPLDFARYLLDRQGLSKVRVEAIPGQLTDHYAPRGPVLRVSSTVAGRSPGGRFPGGLDLGGN